MFYSLGGWKVSFVEMGDFMWYLHTHENSCAKNVLFFLSKKTTIRPFFSLTMLSNQKNKFQP